MKHPASLASRLAVSLTVLILLLAASRAYVSTQTPAAKPPTFDREYSLETTMLGYRGVGGNRRCPQPDAVGAHGRVGAEITIVNGELMVHDIALEGLNIKRPAILDKAARANITFTATKSDIYYCSVPGHRLAGMEGRIDVSDEPRVTSEGVPRNGQRTRAESRFRERHHGRLDRDGRCVRAREGRRGSRAGSRQERWQGQRILGEQQHRWRHPKGHADVHPFRVTQPYGSFLVSGGAFTSTRVDVLLAPVPSQGDIRTRQVIFTISGANNPTLRPVVVDLKSFVGRDIMIRLVDDETGQTVAAYLKSVPGRASTTITSASTTPDRSSPPRSRRRRSTRCRRWTRSGTPDLSASEAAKAMTVPEGFTVTLAPRSPTSSSRLPCARRSRPPVGRRSVHVSDPRARGTGAGDRILIFEDTDGDGQFDSRKVFAEGLNLVSGLEVGFGGVWVGAAPYLLFIPDRRRRRRPDGQAGGAARRLGLPGHARNAQHVHLGTRRLALRLPRRVHALERRQARHAGTERTPLNAGIWRYHPTRHEFEVFADGTSNPWGVDFNDHGQAFSTACVIPHLFHIIQGGALPAAGRAALQPVHLRRHQDDRRPSALGREPVDRTSGNNRSRRSRRRTRACRRDDLSRRRRLARASIATRSS